MKTKILISLVVGCLLLGGLAVSRQVSDTKASALRTDEALEHLSIEKFDKKIVAPDFALQDLNGRTVRLSELKGRVVFLNFWATWCPTCTLEMPQMAQLEKEFGRQGLTVLTVNFQEAPDTVKQFFAQQGLDFTTVIDQKSEVVARYQAWWLPTTFLINRDGEIEGKVVGYRDWYSDPSRELFRQLVAN
jgi:cytochrome c biogenesis protein CcmG, thiol:disulfide interchange protein DsbE